MRAVDGTKFVGEFAKKKKYKNKKVYNHWQLAHSLHRAQLIKLPNLISKPKKKKKEE